MFPGILKFPLICVSTHGSSQRVWNPNFSGPGKTCNLKASSWTLWTLWTWTLEIFNTVSLFWIKYDAKNVMIQLQNFVKKKYFGMRYFAYFFLEQIKQLWDRSIFYILSETRMLRNHYFSFFLSTKVCYLLQDLLIVGVVCQSVFNPFIEFSHLGVNNSWLI